MNKRLMLRLNIECIAFAEFSAEFMSERKQTIIICFLCFARRPRVAFHGVCQRVNYTFQTGLIVSLLTTTSL